MHDMNVSTSVLVIGGGITGLSCAHLLVSLGVDALVLESSPSPGGKIATIHHGGYEFEPGPNTLIANHQEMLDLIGEVGLTHDIIEGSAAAKRRYVAFQGKLCPIPQSPIAALRSPLLGPAAIARAALDLVTPRNVNRPDDEPVAAFISRRFGRDILDNLVAPFLTGIYAGSADELEARAILPKLVEAEDSHGSVIRGLLARRRALRAAGTPPLPARSVTFRHGLSAIPHRLAKLLGNRVRTGLTATSITPMPSGCAVRCADGATVNAQRVVIATSPGAASRLVSTIPDAEHISTGLAGIPCASLAVVGLGYDRSAIDHPLDGFGYLRGPGTPGPLLGCLFRSSVFPHTAPERKVLLTAFVGGVPFPDAPHLPDEALVGIVHEDLSNRLGIHARPEEVFIRKWLHAIPQLNRGYSTLRHDVAAWSARGPVSVVGSAITGLSLNNCAEAGRAEARRLASILAGTPTLARQPAQEELCHSA